MADSTRNVAGSPRRNPIASQIELGFPLWAIPVITIVGILFAMVTSPGSFEWLQDSVPRSWPSEPATTLTEWSADLSSSVQQLEQDFRISSHLWDVALFAIPASLLASLVQAARAKTLKPTAGAFCALAMGIILIPALAWIGEIGVVAFRLGAAVQRWLVSVSLAIRDFVVDHKFAIGTTIAIAAAALTIWLVGRWAIHNFAEFFENLAVGLFFIVVGAAAVAAVAWIFTTGFGQAIARFFRTVSEWVGGIVGPIIGWVMIALLWASVVLAIIGITVAIFGTIGRTIVLGIKSSILCARSQSNLLDSFFGIGLGLSMLFSAALVHSGLHYGLWVGWTAHPLARHVPYPDGFFDFLTPSAAEQFLGIAFSSTTSIALDLLLICAAAVIASVALIVTTNDWDGQWGWRMAVPVLLIAGLAIAALIPIAILIGFSYSNSNS